MGSKIGVIPKRLLNVEFDAEKRDKLINCLHGVLPMSQLLPFMENVDGHEICRNDLILSSSHTSSNSLKS